MLDLNAIANYCFVEITSKQDIKLINQAKSNYDLNKILCLFFHYDDKKSLQDHELVKYLENQTNMNINWVDISKVFSETVKVNNMLGLYISNDNSEEFNKNIRSNIILKEIKDYFKDNILKYKNFMEFKGTNHGK